MANGARERAESNSSSGSGSIAGGNNSKAKRQKHGNNSNNNKIRPVTVETVRRIVAQEGRSARNLISWNAPLYTTEEENTVTTSKPKSQQKLSTVKRRSKSYDTADKKEIESSRTSREGKGSSVSRSSSVNKKQVSIRARYWAYLFENLRRAVDEIYATCENDQSVVECKEVLLVLDNYRHEFQALIDWINLQERLNSADVASRPTSLAWEVRKSSPGRPRQRMTPRNSQQGGVYFSRPSQMSPGVPAPSTGNVPPSPHIKRTNSDKKSSGSKSSSNSVTWADKVKGVPSNTKSPPNNQQKGGEASKKKVASGNTSGGQTDDDEGWEKVSSKSKQMKSAQSKGTNVTSNKSSNKQNSSAVNNHKSRTKMAKIEPSGVKSAKTDIVKTEKPQKVVKDTNSNLIIVNGKAASEKDQEVANSLDFFVDSVGEDPSSSRLSGVASNETHSPSYANVVVERNMGTGIQSMSSSRTSSKPSDKTESLENAEKKLPKVLFQDDETENDISLQSLDEVEAEYFKTDPTVDEDEESMLASLDESESKTNQALLEHDASIAAAEQEEQQLMKEIEEEEKKTIEEVEIENKSTPTSGNETSDWNSIMARFEVEQQMHKGMTWGDLMDEEELREPGRAVQMHEKLSSPSRKRTPAESKRKMEEKQRSATLRREKMVQDKTERIHVLTEKVMDVKKLKAELIMERRGLLHDLHKEKLQRAAQQRAMSLMKIVQKAQAEETKVNEILFINELQEQNKRHDVLNRILEHDARLLEIQQERSKMQEVKAAKEENVKERRRILEKERQDRLSELINKRKEQDSRIENLKLEKEKEREKIAREKERERKIRLSALNAAQQEAVTELQKKIQMKHDESERRHQEQLEQRKEKALELSLGRFSLSSSGNLPSGEMQTVMSEGDKTSVRAGATSIDLSLVEGEDVKGKGDAAPVSKTSPKEAISSPRGTSSASEEKKLAKEKEEKMKERKKAMKKRAKKLKTRMATRGREFLKAFDQKLGNTSTSNKNKIYRLVKDINRQLTNQKESSGPWPSNRVSALDRALGEINRLLEKQDRTEKDMFRISGGFEMLERIFELPLNASGFQGPKGEPVPVIPDKTLSNAATSFRLACEHCYDNALYVLYGNRISILVDALMQQLTKHFSEESTLTSTSKSPVSSRKPATHGNITQDCMFDSAASSLLHTLAFSIKLLELEMTTQDANEKIYFSENKLLLRALKRTVMTSTKSTMEFDDIDTKRLVEGYLNRGLDVVSYLVSCGVLDKLTCYLGSVRSEIEAESKATSFIKNGLAFLSSVTDFVSLRNRITLENSEGRTRRISTSSNSSSMGNEKKASLGDSFVGSTDPQGWDNDPTQLLPTLYHTELMGVVSVLYGILLHGAPERPTLLRINSIDDVDDVTSSSPPQKKIPIHALQIAMSVMKVLNAVADLDIHLLQASLGAEGVSLEFRHICTYLLWYCQHGEYDGLLHAVIVCVGHFAIRNQKNQDTVHSGAMPTVLQQLCVLPFAYFSNPRLSDILFPTLIACCHDNPTNLAMLEQEASSSLLAGYIQGILAECENGDNENLKTIRDDKPLSKDRASVSLTSNRFYTVSFLCEALQFFQGDLTTSNDAKVNGEVVELVSS